jgi:hypothetical protein
MAANDSELLQQSNALLPPAAMLEFNSADEQPLLKMRNSRFLKNY